MGLTGSVAVVTGAGGGIGDAIATELASAGAAVAIWDVNGERAQQVGKRIEGEAGVRTLALDVDIANRTAVTDAVAAVERDLGPVDILVNNAGVDVIGPFLDSKEDDWDRIIRVNLRGPIVCCHAVLPGMVERGRGRIISIGSDAGRVGSSGETVYAATKGGVIALTKSLAREVARHGITVNCVCPGPTDTALLDQVAEASQKLYDSLARAIPMRRIGQPVDIAPVVAFLAGDGASFITGQTVSVSGGLTMS
jgi:2-hydroxycyclohexanecarboxyl-CoA dehydrogenase